MGEILTTSEEAPPRSIVRTSLESLSRLSRVVVGAIQDRVITGTGDFDGYVSYQTPEESVILVQEII